MAKLRMHTDDTLKIFDGLTVRIGSNFCAFNKHTCPAFDTKELRREFDARKRRQAKRASANGASNSSNLHYKPSASNLTSKAEADGPLPKTLSTDTYKHHSLGDYPKAIRQVGTIDSISTEPVRAFATYNEFGALTYHFRVNWSTVHLKPATSVRIAIPSTSSGSWLRLSAAMPAFVELERKQGCAVLASTWLVHPRSIII